MCDGEQGWWWVWWLTFHGEWAHQDGGAGTHLTMKSECAPCMICFSERMCSCCLVSTMWRFLRIFMAKVLDSSLFNWTLKKSTENKWEKGHSVNITECLLIPKLPSAWSTAGTPQMPPESHSMCLPEPGRNPGPLPLSTVLPLDQRECN